MIPLSHSYKEDRMVKKEKEKKVSIYDLFNREKLVSIQDDVGKIVNILFVKMTQGERNDAVDVMNRIQKEEEDRIKNDKLDSENIQRVLSTASKDELIKSILDIEEIEERTGLDKFIIPDEDKLTEEEIKKKQEENIKSWKSDRKEFVEKNYNEDTLKEEIFNFRVRSLAMIRALYEYDLECLSYMCREPDNNKKRIFHNRDDVVRVKDKRVLDKLLEELKEFRKFETDKEVRKAAQDSDFLAPGESQVK